MYRCGACNRPSKAGQPCLKHILYKPCGNIEREIPLCGYCKRDLDRGASFRVILKEGAEIRRGDQEALEHKRRKHRLDRQKNRPVKSTVRTSKPFPQENPPAPVKQVEIQDVWVNVPLEIGKPVKST